MIGRICSDRILFWSEAKGKMTMKPYTGLLFFASLVLTGFLAQTGFGQQMDAAQKTNAAQQAGAPQQPAAVPMGSMDFMKELQSLPSQVASEILQALQRGDMQTAQQIYASFKAKNMNAAALKSAATGSAPLQPEKPSLFERTLSGEFPTDLLTIGMEQFGYDLFLRTTSSFFPSGAVPVGPDYIMGPGDQFTMTLWGTTEGIFTFQVSKEGKITLPKVGVVAVAGIRFGELEKTLRKHLAKHYTNFNLSVAMGSLKTLTIYVVGEVRNPGSYSLNSLTSVYGALFAAGGPTKKGSMRAIQVLRAGKVVKTLDLYDFLLRGDRSQDIRLQHDDTVFVPLIGPIAGVAGSVYRPAIYELKGTESLGDTLRLAGGIMPIARGSRLQILRYSGHENKSLLDITLPGPAEEKGNPDLDAKVQNMDTITVFPLYDHVWETVELSGSVRYPGKLQWKPDLRLRDVIKHGQLLPTADLRRAEIIRLTENFMDRKIIPIDVDALIKGDETQNPLLQPKDHVKVYTTYHEAEKIAVSGEVIRPGIYETHGNERLSDLIRRVGGFTPEAYPYGAVLKRKDVKASQAKHFQTFIAKMQSQVLQSSAQGAATASSPEEASYKKTELTLNQGIIDNLKAIQDQFEGRVAINITEEVDKWAGTKDDLLLQDGDSLLIPKRPQEVLVIGEVHNQGAQIFQPGLTVKEYIEHTGGLTKEAEKSEIFVVKANGFAFGKDSPSVGNLENVQLHAGDTIFVPQRVERYAIARFVKDIVDIVFKAAVVVGLIVAAF